jgi:hypothetical protein
MSGTIKTNARGKGKQLKLNGKSEQRISAIYRNYSNPA